MQWNKDKHSIRCSAFCSTRRLCFLEKSAKTKMSYQNFVGINLDCHLRLQGDFQKLLSLSEEKNVKILKASGKKARDSAGVFPLIR